MYERSRRYKCDDDDEVVPYRGDKAKEDEEMMKVQDEEGASGKSGRRNKVKIAFKLFTHGTVEILCRRTMGKRSARLDEIHTPENR